MDSQSLASQIIYACWAAWLLYWVIMWHKQKPVTEAQNPTQRGGYTILLTAGILLLIYGYRLPRVGVRVLPDSIVVAAAAVLLAILGVGITIWARRVLADNWSADVSFKQDQQLVTSGPYAITRHPIYTGLTLLFLGTATLQGTWAGFKGLALAFISFQIKLGQEERLMLLHYGDAYTSYQKRTRRIIPFLY